MSLVSLADISSDKIIDKIIGNESVTEVVNGSSIKYFKNYLGTIERNKHYHFWTGGQWSMQDLLIFLLSITGSADVYITTWSISEDAVRSLLHLKEKNLIRKMNCVFDYKCKETKTKAFLLAKQNFDVTLTGIHAKVTVIENENWKMTVTGSANWTRNPRAERQLLCTVAAVAEEDIRIIKLLMTGENPFRVR